MGLHDCFENTAEHFGKHIEYLWTAFTTEGKTNCKVEFFVPTNAKQMPEIWVDGHDFESGCYVDFC